MIKFSSKNQENFEEDNISTCFDIAKTYLGQKEYKTDYVYPYCIVNDKNKVTLAKTIIYDGLISQTENSIFFKIKILNDQKTNLGKNRIVFTLETSDLKEILVFDIFIYRYKMLRKKSFIKKV